MSALMKWGNQKFGDRKFGNHKIWVNHDKQIKLLAGLGAGEPPGLLGILLVNGGFFILFAGSAWLFWKAAGG